MKEIFLKKAKRFDEMRGVFLFPNLLTTAGLFAAFYSVVAAFQGFYESACIAVFIAMGADAFDGRVARMTNTESPFGAEYDSLSDMVSFGVAPALLVYSWALEDLGKLGWLCAFIYTACTALRLARFNTKIGTVSKRYFQGLPCPPAAAILVSYIWLCFSAGVNNIWMDYCAAGLSVWLAVLMVSDIPYYSFKDLDLKGRVPFMGIVLVVLIMVMVYTFPALVILVTFGLYALAGLVMSLIRMVRKKRKLPFH